MKKTFYFFIFFSISFYGFSQINKYGYPLNKFYSPNEIGTIGQNWGVLSSNNGLIYVANNLGMILEYDGENWRKITIENEPEIRALAIDKHGTIYVGCTYEFGCLKPNRQGGYVYKNLSQLLPDSLQNVSKIYNVNAINDTIYFSNDKNLVFGYIPAKEELFTISLPRNSLFTFKINNTLFGSSYTSGLFEIDKNGSKIIKGGDFYKEKNIYSIISNNQNIYVITGDQGIFNFDLNSGVSSQMLSPKTLFKIKDFITYSAEFENGSFFTGNLGSGLMVYDQFGTIDSRLINEIGIKDGYCIDVRNYENTTWSTFILGLSNVEFDNSIRVLGESAGLNSFINDIISFNNKLYVATDIGVFYLTYDKEENPIFEKIIGFDNQVWSLSVLKPYPSNEEILLIGTNEGIYQLNNTHSSIVSVEENIINLKSLFPDIHENELAKVKLYIYELYSSNNKGLLWCGTSDRLLALKYLGKNKWTSTPAVYNIGDRISSIAEDKNGYIYASTHRKGIIKVDTDSFNSEIIDTLQGITSLKNLRVFPFNSTVCMGTSEGLLEYDTTLKTFKKIVGIPENYYKGDITIKLVLQLSDSSLILSVAEGQETRIDFLEFRNNKYIPAKPNIKRLGNISTESFFEFDGRIWFSNSDQLYSVKINENYVLDTLYHCLIRKVEGIDSVYFLGNFYKESVRGLQFSDIQSEKQTPVLSYRKNDLTFHFAAPFYEGDDDIMYSYKLEGFKNQWSRWDKEPKAVFTNLNAGQYTFLVKAKNIFGVESIVGSYSFSVLPPWYRTIVAYIFYLIIAIFSVWVIVKLYTHKLKLEKIRLEGIVEERTAEIREQRDQIAEQKQSIEDSIMYASRIQRAILPSKDMADEILPEYFILFRPRDIVSGDYYWMNKIGSKIIVVAADCTGHGVPGAFMSMLGVSFLNEIVLKEKVLEPHLILNHLRDRVKKTLKQEGKEGENKDGMDVALIVIDEETKKLYFAGAYNPTYIYRGEQLFEIKADRMPIGIYIKEKESFTLNEFDYIPGDTFYIFSDGYEDQFGGPDKQKFRAKQVRELLQSIQTKSMSEQKEILNNTIENWMGPDQDQIDDMVLVGVRLK